MEDPSLSDHYSTTYGVNRNSILNSLQYFHVCNDSMPPDILHDVLEGYLPYKVKVMLKHYTLVKKYFKLIDLNYIIASFKYGYGESSSIPTPISSKTLSSEDKTNLCQSGLFWIIIHEYVLYSYNYKLTHQTYPSFYTASQMWTLGRLLPVMIGHLVPSDDSHWLHYLELLEMIDIIFAPHVEKSIPAYLQVLIENILQEFTELYPNDSVIPKMHFLVHIPSYMAKHIE